MESKIYVGNLPYSVNEDALTKHFERYGNVTSAKIITDRDTNRSKGFAFVEMAIESEAMAAIASLDGAELDGRALKVNAARPRD